MNKFNFKPFIVDSEYKKFFAEKLLGRDEIEVMADYITADEREMTLFQRVDLLIGWERDNRPYYRLFPGVLDFLMRQDPQKFFDLDLRFPFGLNTLSVEIPDTYWGTCGFQSAVFCAELEGGFRTLIHVKDRTYASMDFHKNFDFNKEDFTQWRVSPKFVKTVSQLLIGILAIGEDPDLIKPVVLAKDREKYALTKDPKYIEKAKRRHNFGFEIGTDIPTEEELKALIAENNIAREHGRPIPHIRCAHLAGRWTGTGRKIYKIVKVKSSFVNKDLLITIPQGYHNE